VIQAVRDWWALVKEYRNSVIVGAGLLLIFFVLVFAVGVGTWEYTNSVAFCGTTCHTMPPEFVAYQQSPHARVPCVDCHLGRESAFNAIPRKAREISHVTNFFAADYHTPIYVRNLRPARETCEECHFPQKFSADTFRELTRYQLDEANTQQNTYLILKTGGQVRPGLSRGIHWHIASQVWFLADDRLKQDIVYVKEIDNDGTVKEYYDVTAGITPEDVAQRQDELELMDCIDCHNRTSHEFPSPEEAVDEALSTGRLDAGIPFIKAWGVDMLREQFLSQEEAWAKIDRLDGWYQRNYPDFYIQKQSVVQDAITELKNLYQETVFPDMDIGWATHPDNLGHKEFPGCFRCHGGNHVSQEGDAIRLECNICHTIPEVTGPGQPAPVINVGRVAAEDARVQEPASHRNTNWLFIHRDEQVAQDAECTGCHNTSDAGLATNVSFCSNSACHGVEWVYAGLDAPALREAIQEQTQLPVPTVVPEAEVAQAEAAVPPVPAADLEKSRGPNIPHELSEGRRECLRCHAVEGGLFPPPANHADYTQEECTQCHRPSRETLEGESQ
jgi:nitrate/TMAO reductase-like tetraheme cytochrome c subunit